MLNIQCENGSTPLHEAVKIRNLKIVELMIFSGADIKIKDNSSFTPIDYAKSSGDKEIIKLLKKPVVIRKY
jgi:hypothetical protein